MAEHPAVKAKFEARLEGARQELKAIGENVTELQKDIEILVRVLHLSRTAFVWARHMSMSHRMC